MIKPDLHSHFPENDYWLDSPAHDTVFIWSAYGRRTMLLPAMHITYRNPDTNQITCSTVFKDKKLLYVRTGHELRQLTILHVLDNYFEDVEAERQECWVNRTKRKLNLLIEV